MRGGSENDNLYPIHPIFGIDSSIALHIQNIHPFAGGDIMPSELFSSIIFVLVLLIAFLVACALNALNQKRIHNRGR